jgi:hypothetical protein
VYATPTRSASQSPRPDRPGRPVGITGLPCSVSIEIQHIRSFFHPFSNQNPEHPQRHLNLASESCFGTCSQSRCSSHTGVLFALSRCSSRNESSGGCLPLFPLDFSPSPSTSASPSPIHLLHDLTIFPAWPRVFSCVSCESRLYRGRPRPPYQRWDCRRRSGQNPSAQGLSHLANSHFISKPAWSPHSSVPRSLLPAESRCQSYSLIETLTTCNFPFPSPATWRGPCWPRPPNMLLEPRPQDMWSELQYSALVLGRELRRK